MSAIHTKSITGITSITTPPGVDNIFTVHSSDTTERFRVDGSGNQNLSGIITASNFKTGVSNLHNLGLTLSSGQLDIGSNIKAGNAGVITATAFHGSGANLTGITAGVTANTGDPNNTHSTNSASALTSNSKYNTIFGWNAGNNISTGDQNTIYGYRAGGVHNNSQETIIGANCFSERSNHTKAVGLGYGAGMWNQGANNTAIGYESVGAHGTSNGDNNTGVGYNALRHITDGDNNVALGYQANNQHTTGSNCIVIGANADASSVSVSNEITLGDSNINHLRIPGIGVSFSEGGGVTTGIMTASAFKLLDGSAVGGVESDSDQNTVGGTNAGDSITSGSGLRNTVFGYDAGTAISTGDNNTFFGTDAGKAITSTGTNTAIGWDALSNQSGGSTNTAVGAKALFNCQGDENVALGYGALQSLNSGGQNTAIGYGAGGSGSTNGYYNTAIGFEALKYAAGYTNSNYNVGVGWKAFDRATNSTVGVVAIGKEAGAGVDNGTHSVFIGYEAAHTNTYNLPNCIVIGGNANPSATNVANEITLGDSNISHFRMPGIGVSFGRNGATIAGVVTTTAVVTDFQPRNMIINGAMQINARTNGTLTINSSTGQYPCDRWVARGEGGSKAFTILKTSIASSGRGVRNSVKVTSSQAASVSDYDIFNFRQMIEGFNTQRLNLGEAGCASMALSFTVRSSVAGTHSGAIQNSAQNRSYPFTYTLVANTWKDVKIIIPPITSGSFNEGTGVGLRVVFDMGSGNAFRGTANQWNSAQNEGATGAVRILETNGATWEITKVQLEEGTVCTPFEKRMITQETALCERYYQRYGAQRHNWMTNVNGTDHRKMVYFPTTMRTSPTMNLYDQSVDGSSVSAQYVSPNGYACRLNGNGRHASWKHEATAEL